jgi:hypothetical protein
MMPMMNNETDSKDVNFGFSSNTNESVMFEEIKSQETNIQKV